MELLNPSELASFYRMKIRAEVEQSNINININIIGFLASNNPASLTYAEYTKKACEDVGISFNLKIVDSSKIEKSIKQANRDEDIHGIFVYYPIFDVEQDNKLKEIVDYKKDVEGLTSYWLNKLYKNERFDYVKNQKSKSILPCTPLAILKLLEKTEAYSDYGLPFQDQIITIFNRSDVVGKPLAYMLANDGAKVFSFDINGGLEITKETTKETNIERIEALKQTDIVITGVPSKNFEKIKASELKEKAICLNFSTIQNFSDEAKEYGSVYIPRVGPLTVAMCLRNALKLYKNYHIKEII
jgi:methylenetetrahydrofolate dehydrogenase (NADP+)/methenyltetrahydrofolate cyclohydrolase